MKQSRVKLAQTIAGRTLQDGVRREYSREIAAYLLSERRVNELNSLLRDIQADWTEAGYVEVIATSAYSLTPEIKADIEGEVRKLHPNAKQIIVTESHDPAVIGGVQLELANRQLDLTIEAKLNKFKQLTTAGKD